MSRDAFQPPRRLRLNRAAFFRSIGYEPHPGQAAVHASRASRRILACGVRWGKTRAAAVEGLCAAMEPAERSMGWVVAPTYDLADKVFREIQILVLKYLRHRIISIRESDRRILLRNMAGGVSEIRAKSADNEVSLIGEGLDWLIVDECARLKPSTWQSHLSQRLIDRRGWALLISTPRGKGWFYEMFRRGRSGDGHHESWNGPSWQNPHLDRELIEAERGRLPERVFRQEYGGEFIEGSGSVFHNVRECATADWCGPRIGTSYVSGLDIARVEDYTVHVVMGYDRRVMYVARYTGVPWETQVAKVRYVAKSYMDARVLLDSTGIGDPFYDSLRMAEVKVQKYPFTQRSKAALIDNLAMMIEGGHIVLPKPEVWPAGIDELEAYEYSTSEHGTVRMAAPSGSHDDCVSALALAAWQVRLNRPMYRVRRLLRVTLQQAREYRRLQGPQGPITPLGRGT